MEQLNHVKVKRPGKSTLAVLITAGILAALVLINVGVGFIPRAYSNFVVDSSDAFTLSDESKSFFKQLDTDVTIYYIDDPNMYYDYEWAPQFRVMLDKYANLSDHVKIVYVDVEDTDFISKYYSEQEQSQSGALPGSSLIIEGPERFDVIPYFHLFKYAFPADGITLTFPQMMELYSTWGNLYSSYSQSGDKNTAAAYADAQIKQTYGIQNFYAECLNNIAIFSGDTSYDPHHHWYADAVVTAAVDFVTTQQIPTTYFLTGHGETETSEYFAETYLQGFDVRHFPLDLTDKTEIPSNAVTLVLNNPQSDISAQEKQLLQGFIASGGALILTTAPKAADMPNLMALVNGYGLQMQNAVVYDDSISYNSTLKNDADKTYPNDYLYFIPDKTQSINSAASALIHQRVCYEEYMRYMTMYQNTQNQAYLTMAQDAYNKLETATDYQMLVAGAHPITYTETAGVSVKVLASTSDQGYLSTDSTAAKQTVGISAIITTGEVKGALVWYGCADSFTEQVTKELYVHNEAFLFASMDYAGSTAAYRSEYLDIPAIELSDSLDIPALWLVVIPVITILVLPLGTVIAGIVICVVRRRK